MTSVNEPGSITAKILFLGEGAVGKTTLANCITCESILKREATLEKPSVTVGLDIHCLNFMTNNGHYKLSLWDFAGQPQFRFFQDDLMKKSLIGVLVFDVTRNSSFLRLTEWKEMAEKHSQTIQFIVVGNKIDSQNRTVTREMGRKYAEKIKAPYFETSAKTMKGLEELQNEIKNYVMDITTEGHI